jgi:carboxyl-terminal processing protease
VFYEGPLVVLTSRFSASASEILAGALQDYGRGLVVGDAATHGKGTVQSLLQLAPLMRGHMALVSSNNPGALKITIRKFYRASGASTQLRGVTPDIILPSIYNHDEVGENSLDNPLPWDTIAPASYEKLNWIQPILPELRRRSDGRVNVDRDFAFLKDEIERFKQKLAEKSVSLNEAQRLKEKQEADERNKARKKELASRPEPLWKVYEITLKNAEQPGLPPPVAKTNSVKTASATTGTGTNTVAKNDTEENEEHVEEKITAVDMTLEEAKRILVDLVSLMARGGSLVGATVN